MNVRELMVRMGLVLAVAGALAACGGGGGGSDDDDPPTGDAPLVAITEDNAPAVSAEALDAGRTGSSNRDVSAGAGASPAAAMPGALMARLARQTVQNMAAIGPTARVNAVVDETQNCAGGGTVEITGNVASEAQPTVGDTLQFDYDDCVQDGVTLNGETQNEFVDFNGDLSYLVLDVTPMDEVIATIGTLETRVSGTSRVTFDGTDATSAKLTQVGSPITVKRYSSGSLRASRTLTDYVYEAVVDRTTLNSSATFSYNISGDFPSLGSGSFVVLTTAPFVTASGAAEPSSGVAEVVGAGDSNLTMTAVADGLQVEVDENGDGTFESTQTYTWEEVDAEL